MSQIDQNNAMLSLEKALVPKSNLIDARSETDQLGMLVDFAALFNFYDKDNTINGNWSPFLLKDPVFLVASIAKTNFQKAYSLFMNTSMRLQGWLLKINTNNSPTIEDELNYFISNAFNQLFDQLTLIFQTIESWTHYMKTSNSVYNLKTYVINNVKETYSLLLWSLLAFRQQLVSQTIIENIAPVDTYLYENYDEKVWQENKGKSPYWTVLKLPTVPCEGDPQTQCFDITTLKKEDVYKALKYTSKQLFSFYNNCISYADTELTTIKKVPGHFPDTILLRTFTKLLEVYQNQFNGLAGKHLDFYYRTILKQTPNTVVADTVFACCELTSTKDTFRLAKDVTFAAGTDANKNPILFETTQSASLNPAKIVNAYTLTKGTDVQLYLEQLAPVNVVAKNESRVVQSWNIFGSQTKPLGSQKNMAIAFGSPMFYLAEANTRTITLNFTFSSASTIAIAQSSVTFYLSTTKAWFQVPQDQITFGSENNPATTTITLHETDPAIAAFAKNPDGYTSDWPLCKMVFSDYSGIENQIVIEKLDIDVSVDGFKSFQLFNDFGAMDSTKPFQPFGVAPNMNQNFMIGSNEIFSKLVKDISVTMTWNPFPIGFDFAAYYKEYNDYLQGKYAPIPVDADADKKILQEVLKLVEEGIEKILKIVAATNKDSIVCDIQIIMVIIHDIIKSIKNIIHVESILFPDTKAMLDTLKQDINEVIQNLKSEENSSSADIGDIKASLTTIVETAKDSYSEKIKNINSQLPETTNSNNKTILTRLSGVISNILKKEPLKIIILNTFQYSNSSFLVDFSLLQNGIWNPFIYKFKDKAHCTSSVSPLSLYFSESNKNTSSIPATRTFNFSGIKVDKTQIDPTLQQTPLQLTDTTSLGFLKMQLIKPNDGFGADLYAKVVGAIALYNGNIIAHRGAVSDLINPPNIPFTPITSTITGTYAASASCDFKTIENNTYPLECFYYTPFQNYKVYDTTNGISIGDTTIGNPLIKDKKGAIIIVDGLPLVPSFTSNGQLFLELENVVAPAEISFYFELATTYTETPLTENAIEFSYLSTTGWKTLTVIVDGTNDFTCSGIITLNVPEDITNDHESMPRTNFWIAIGTQENTDGYAKASFLKTNGITLKRIVNATDFSPNTPELKANIISTPVNAVTQLSKTVQPFPSFGGKAAETTQHMNSRVSNRLKTKDRLITAEDYFNTIRIQFLEVYFSKTNYDTSQKKVMTYLVKRVSDATVSHAFEPLVSNCTELEIQEYIQTKISAFTQIGVSNFTLAYVKIKANITVATDYEITTVSKEINDGINIFLSPWITSAQAQITIDKGINTAQIASFINSFDGVIEVKDISFLIGQKDFTKGTITYDPKQKPKQEYTPVNKKLIVPSLNNLTEGSSINYHFPKV